MPHLTKKVSKLKSNYIQEIITSSRNISINLKGKWLKTPQLILIIQVLSSRSNLTRRGQDRRLLVRSGHFSKFRCLKL